MTNIDVPIRAAVNVCLPITESTESRRYSGSRYLFRSAAKAFGVELTDQEDDDWRALLGGAYLIDHLLDVERVDIMPHITSIISGNLREDLHEETQLRFRSYILRQSEERYDDIMSNLGQVSDLVHRQVEAEDAREVVAVRCEEADLYAHLLCLPTDESRGDLDARNRFNDWLLSFSRSGYLLDSLKDMKLDYDNGDSGVRPTIKSKATIAAAAIKECMVATRKTPPRLLGNCALVGARYLLANSKPDMTDLGRP